MNNAMITYKNQNESVHQSKLRPMLQKISATLLAALMVLQLTACSDKSWCVKDSDETIPIGVYIYYMYAAYQSKYYELSQQNNNYSGNIYGQSDISFNVDVFSQTFDDKPADQWIQDKAIRNSKMLLSIDAKMKELGVEFTDEEELTARQSGDEAWKKIGASMESFGISRNSYDIATGIMSAKYEKLFKAIYGKDGTEPFTDDQMKDYMLQNYMDYSVIKKSFSTGSVDEDQVSFSSDETGSDSDAIPYEELNNSSSDATPSETPSEASSDPNAESTSDADSTPDAEATPSEDEIKTQQQFANYENMIAQGSTMEQVAEQYMQDDSLQSSPLQSATDNKLTTPMPQEVKDIYDQMPNNSAKSVKSGNTYYLVYKKDVSEQFSKLDDETSRDQLLQDMKSEEFDDNLEADIENLGVIVNSSAVKAYPSTMFEKNKKNSSSKSSKSKKSSK